MIRINLLPVKAARKREYGRQQLVLFGFLAVLEIVILALVFQQKAAELSDIERAVNDARTQVDEISTLEGRIASLDSERANLASAREMLENLQANRIGPGGVLQELKQIMNPPASPREREEQHDRGWNVGDDGDDGWDARRVWLDSVAVDSRGFRLRGIARTLEDVAEFLYRLESSRVDQDPFFVSPELSSNSTGSDAYFGQVMQFSITGGIRYHPMILQTNN